MSKTRNSTSPEHALRPTSGVGSTDAFRPRRIAIVFAHVASNIGDLAINRGQIRLLREVWPEAAIHAVYFNADKSAYLDDARGSLHFGTPLPTSMFKSHSELALTYLGDPAQFLSDAGIDDADLIVLSAGEHIFHYQHGENLANFFWRTLPALSAQAAGVRCVLMPSTLGPFEDPKSVELARSLLELVDGYAVRDMRSPAELKVGLGIDTPPQVLLDPAFFLEKPASAVRDPSTVALVMRSENWGIRKSKLTRVAPEDEQVTSTAAYRFARAFVLRWLSQAGRRVHVYVQTDADEALARVLAADIGERVADSQVEVRRPESVDHYVDQLAQAGFVVASRFHAIILGAVAGVPGWAVWFDAHGHKMPGLFDLLGVPERCHRLTQRNAEVMGSNLADQLDAADPQSRQVEERLEVLRARTAEWLATLPDRTVSVATMVRASRAYGHFATTISREGMRAAAEKNVGEAMRVAERQAAEKAEDAVTFRERIAALDAECGLLRKQAEASSRLHRTALDEASREAAEKTQEAIAFKERIATLGAECEVLRKQAEEAGRLHRAALDEAARRTADKELETNSFKERIAASQEALDVANARAQRLEQEVIAVRAELSARNAELERTQRTAAEREKALERVMSEAEEAARASSRRIAAAHRAEIGSLKAKAERDVWRERDKWTSLLAYRAGNVLVENLRRPLAWPLLPFRLFREWQEFRRDQAAHQSAVYNDPELGEEDHDYEHTPILTAPRGHGAVDRAAPTAVVPAPLSATYAARGEEDASSWSLHTFREGGAPAVRDRLALDGRGLSGKSLAMELLRIGKYLHGTGEYDAELPLALTARSVDESFGVLRGVVWAAQRAGDYATACAAILDIERQLGQGGSEAQRRALAQLKGSPAYQLSSLELIEDGRQAGYSPVEKRVCYVLHNSLPYSSGGYATRSHGVAGGLQAQGYEVICITRPGFPMDIKEELSDGSVPMEDVIDGVHYHRIERPWSKGISVPNYVSQSADELEARFRDLRPSVVIAASNYRIGLMAMIAARRLGIPFIYEVRGWWELTRMSRDSSFADTPSYIVQSMLEREVANRSEHVFTLTEPMREALIEKGALPGQVTLLPNSCDPERFVTLPRDLELAERLLIPEGVPVIGYVGTFVDYEGLEDLAEACGILAQRGIEFRLLLVGNENTSGQDRGPITTQILEAADREGFSDWLILTGRVPHDEVERYYSLVDVAPFPRKPWPVCEMVSPMKPLEALAMEKAVVASDVRALAEMLRDGQTGRLFRKGDVASMADVLEELITSPQLRRDLGRNGRAWVQQERTWKGMGLKAAAVVEGIVNAHG